MFNAKDLLDALVRGSSQRPQPPHSSPGGNDISDILREFTQGGRGGATAQQKPSQSGTAEADSGRETGSFGLDDILSELQRRTGDAGKSAGDVLGQARDGMREGADKIGQATGIEDILEKLSGGRSAGEVIEQVQNYMRENQLTTGAVLGGLGAIILGTQTGRSLATSAAKIGALALIGGLAYKAYQNYRAGRPPIANGPDDTEAAPSGSGFDADSVSDEAAVNYIRAMIAAAAADGRLDSAEQERIIGSLKEQGVDAEAEAFLAQQLNNPASIDALVEATRTPEERVQLYTAARLAIDPDTAAESNFLAVLGHRLGLDPDLIKHVNASARQVAA
ncbi:MAG: tellurite resistance TerB family protein [Hyphomicrobiaceae bacterium]